MYPQNKQLSPVKKENRKTLKRQLDALEREISALQDELDRLKMLENTMKENINYRRKLKQNLQLHHYGSGIRVISMTGADLVFELHAMLANKCNKSHLIRIQDLSEGFHGRSIECDKMLTGLIGRGPEIGIAPCGSSEDAQRSFGRNVRKFLSLDHDLQARPLLLIVEHTYFVNPGNYSVVKYCMPIYMDIGSFLKKPELQQDLPKLLNHICTCLIAYQDRKYQVMQAKSSLSMIRIANTMDYRLLEISVPFNGKNNKQKVVFVLKYESNEFRPKVASIEAKDLSKEASEEISGGVEHFKIYSLEVALQLILMKDTTSSSTSVLTSDSLNSSESALQASRHIEADLGVNKIPRNRGQTSMQPHSAQSMTDEEEDQRQHSPRRGKPRGRGRKMPDPPSKQAEVKSGGRGRGRGRGSKRGSSKGRMLDISQYFEPSKS